MEQKDLQVVGYTEEVRLIGENDTTTIIAKTDTGARRTAVDIDLAGEIGAGPIVGTKKFKSPAGSEQHPLAQLRIEVAGEEHTITAKIADRSEMSHLVRIGRDVLSNKLVNVDIHADEKN